MKTCGQLQSLLGTYIKAGESFIPKLNQALLGLYERGAWKALMAEFTGDASSGYITLPPDFDSILWARINDLPLEINGMPYEYQTRGPGKITPPPGGYSFGLIDRGYVPLMSDAPLLGIDSLIFSLPSGSFASPDSIVVNYTTTSGIEEQTLSPSSGSSITLTPTAPITSVESITFSSMPGRVLVKDPDDFLYAILLPGDGVSSYRRYFIPQVPENTTDTWTLDAVVKRAFIPLTASSDKVYLDNILALKFALLAVTYEDAADEDRASLNWQKSTDILEKELAEIRGGAKTMPQFEIWGVGVQNVKNLHGWAGYYYL